MSGRGAVNHVKAFTGACAPVRTRSHLHYWLGTQGAMEAGTAFEGGDGGAVHQSRLRLYA